MRGRPWRRGGGRRERSCWSVGERVERDERSSLFFSSRLACVLIFLFLSLARALTLQPLAFNALCREGGARGLGECGHRFVGFRKRRRRRKREERKNKELVKRATGGGKKRAAVLFSHSSLSRLPCSCSLFFLPLHRGKVDKCAVMC